MTTVRPLAALLAIAMAYPARPLNAQCPDGTPPPCGQAARALPAANSVAVLYFENTSPDSVDAFLADGLTEEVILRLQQVPRLVVKSRYESQRVRGRRNAAPAALGRALGSRYLVDGTIQRAGARLVVRVELTRADQGVGIWSERYDRTSGNVLDVIDDVARGVATGVAGRLLPGEAAELARRPSRDPLAYEAFVRGNVYLGQRNPAAFARAVEQYTIAYSRDSALKAALARVAYAYALGAVYGIGDLTPDSVLALAPGEVERALRIAPDISDTWIARGILLLMQSFVGHGDHVDAAVAALARAVQLDPRSAEAHHQYAQILVIVGRDSAALAEYRRALELEPGRGVTFVEISLLMLLERRYEEASAWADSAVAADPQMVRGLLQRAYARLLLGDQAGAERDVADALPMAHGGNEGPARAMQAIVLVHRGDTAAARQLAGPITSVWNLDVEALAAIGEADRALAAVETRSGTAVRCYSLRFPATAALRGLARFDQLAAVCPPTERAP
jgi:TolB-like protein/Tfp pilus assembly protein PilF